MLNDFNRYALEQKRKNVWGLKDLTDERNRIDGALYGSRTYVPVFSGVYRYNILQPIVTRSSPMQMYATKDYWKGIDGEANSGWFMMHRYDNTLWGIGNNGHGELAQGDTLTPRQFLVQVPGTWESYSCGENHVGALSGGYLYMWGYNGQGQLGHNDTSPRSSPIQIPGRWKKVFCSYRQTFAVDIKDQLWSWGQNNHGQLGLNDYSYRSTPIQIPGKWSTTIAGSSTSTMALKKNGALYAWGRNNHGELGLNDVVQRNSPCPGIGAGWSQISMSDSHTLLLQRGDGDSMSRIWATGNNDNGQLGLIDRMRRSRPHLIQGARSSPTGTLAYNPINMVLLNQPRNPQAEYEPWHSVHAMNSAWSMIIDQGGGLWWMGYNNGMAPTINYSRFSPNIVGYSFSSPTFIGSKWMVNYDEPSQATIKRGGDHFIALKESFNKVEVQNSDRI